MPQSSTVTFGFNAIKTYEGRSLTPDNWSRYPDNVGAPNTATARNQHYLMQTGLFTTVSSLTAESLTLTGDFGYVEGAASGALINQSTAGNVTLTGLTLDGLKPSSADAYLLINSIDGTAEGATPKLTVSNLRTSNYNADGVTLPVAKSLFGSATGKNLTMTFSDIKLDARDGNTISDENWTDAASSAMNAAYGTSRSIFSTATFFTTLLAASSSDMKYEYAVEADWGAANTAVSDAPRGVTYGKEVTASIQYANSEKRYILAGETDGRYTNPISNSNTEFDFSTGFLPYIGNYTDKGKNTTYPLTEIKVNYKAPGITVGCGTYNDPYIITSAEQLNSVAKAISGEDFPSTIRLPNYRFADHVSISWHDSTVNSNGCGIYNLSATNYNKANDNTKDLGNGSWNQTRVRYYLASAYYKIEGSFTLPDDFKGIGVPSDTNNNVKGSTVFHGVIVGDSNNKPTITIPNDNPLIVVANGAVVKNINIRVTGDITREQTETGNNALYGYNGNNTDAKYYGGVIGEIMGGDNIIDDVTVTYTGTTMLSGAYKHIIAEGGMVGAVVNGALIFRGSNTVSGRSVTGGGIYSNPIVGRVINGYAVYEKIDGRTGTAPVNSDYYPIDTIDRSNTNLLDVDWDKSTITVPDAQSLYIMSLITQSIASTADTANNSNYGANSPSYGYNGYLTGVARLGDYTDVGCGTRAEQPDDYSKFAYRDSVNNLYKTTTDLLNAPIPYIIYRYTKAYKNDDTILSKNYPARTMTSENTKFWEITLEKSDTFEKMDSFKAFRGIGSVGINPYSVLAENKARTAMKVATFDGNNNIINLHISLPRYERDQDNYFHSQNRTLTQAYTGDALSGDYGHDTNLWKLLGLGLFDCVTVKNDSDHEYQFKNFTLQGTIEDKVYSKDNVDITGKTDQTQLFCVGGVVGKRVTYNNDKNTNNNYDTDNNFYNIIFDGFTITGAYSCGGLIGIDATKSARKMKIVGCNSKENGISVTGGYYGNKQELRHGIGSFVGMTFWCRPYIDGGASTSTIYVSNVSTFYDKEENRCIAGGLIGYTGSGAEIKNIKLMGLGSNPAIGSRNVSNAAGFIGFSQAMDQTGNDYQKDCIEIENCTLQDLSVYAKNGAAGFLARCGNTTNTWYPKYIRISNCAVIGSSESKSEIRTYGSADNSGRYCAGGFIADYSINNNTTAITSVIENSYIENYSIEGINAGGIVGSAQVKPRNLKNLYVKNCHIITTAAANGSNGNVGGIVGYSTADLSGYNLKIDGVAFYRRTNGALTDVTTTDAGIIVGRNSASLVDKFIGIGAYHSDIKSDGTYEVVSSKADSASDNTCQFSLIDVQFIDPTDSAKIAYHLYVPVYTKKMLSVGFSAVSLTATPYYRSVYASKIASEIAAGKNTTDRSILVESTGEWTTTFIRYTYPKKQISNTYNWNFDKSIILTLDGNFEALPAGTKLILLDPNANVDRYYTYTLNEPIAVGEKSSLALSLSEFKGEDDFAFVPQNLSDILADTNASNGNDLYEDYYISMYVPNQGSTHGILFSGGTEMSRPGADDKANIVADLYSFVFLGDLFEHEILSDFKVQPANAEITNENNTLTSSVTATIQLKNQNATAYLRNSDIQHAFYISLTSHDADSKVSDMIYGTNQSYITNTTTISYNDGTDHTSTVTERYLGPNYIQLKTGSIKNALLSTSRPVVTISSVSTITFMDINAFPYNPERKDDIGTQVSVKSNIAYSESELLYSSMKKTEEDPAGTFYFVTTRNNAELNFSAVQAEDSADEIGLKTNNRSLLGVNGKYSTLPPLKGKSIYDANDIVDYEASKSITYTISLYQKVTDLNGTHYDLVNNIADYLADVSLTDSEVNLTPDTSDPQRYVYTGTIDHGNPKDQDKMFEADFSCNVITGDTGKREYANYKIYMTVELSDASNTWKDSYIIYTNAKFDPSVIDELS